MKFVVWVDYKPVGVEIDDDNRRIIITDNVAFIVNLKVRKLHLQLQTCLYCTFVAVFSLCPVQ